MKLINFLNRMKNKTYRKIGNKLMERYGLGMELKRYGFYPNRLPLTITGTHGPSIHHEFDHTIFKDSSKFLLYMPKRMGEFKKPGKIGVRHPSAFVMYRRRNNIVPRADRKGSVLFLSHSTILLENEINFQQLFDQLDQLPEDYHPISFCLHFYDDREKITKPITDRGFTYFTLTKEPLEDQIKSFYELIPQFKYALANNYTTPVLYTVELGLPTAIFCTEDKFINYGDPNFKDVDIDEARNKNWLLQSINEMFKYPKQEITQEQKDLVYNELGLDLLGNKWTQVKVMTVLWFDFFISFIPSFFKVLGDKVSTKLGMKKKL